MLQCFQGWCHEKVASLAQLRPDPRLPAQVDLDNDVVEMGPNSPPPELAPSCAEAGVLGVLPGIIGSMQALEAIKLILDFGDPLIGRLLAFDATEMSFSEFRIKPDPANEVTWANRELIEVVQLDGLCSAQLASV